MNAAHYRRLFDYNYWAHRRVWECATALTDEQLRRPCDYSIGSVYEQLVHTMGAEWLFLQRVQGISPDYIPAAESYAGLDAIRLHWDEIEAGWRAYLAGLSDSQLNETVTFTSITGRQQRTMPLWELLSQIINHSTDHRAQTLALIHQVGGGTLEQDFIFYAWEHPA